MSETTVITLNSTNLVPAIRTNNSLSITNVVDFTGKEMRVKSISIVHWFPLLLTDASFTYVWIDGTEVTVPLNDAGQYIAFEISDKLKNVMHANGHYLKHDTDSTLDLYYLQFSSVCITRCLSCTSLPIPTVMPANYSLGTPTGSEIPTWLLPATSRNPQFNFSDLMELTQKSTIPTGLFPEVQTVPRRYYKVANNIYCDSSSLLVHCNVTGSMLPRCYLNGYHRKRITAEFDTEWATCLDGVLDNIVLTLYDANELPLYIVDADYTITLEYRDKAVEAPPVEPPVEEPPAEPPVEEL